jgi:hypothetical protein
MKTITGRIERNTLIPIYTTWRERTRSRGARRGSGDCREFLMKQDGDGAGGLMRRIDDDFIL